MLVLQSFRDKDAERVWQRQRSKRLDQPTQRAALRKLLILDAADQIGDLRVPPGNRLEKLKGDRAPTPTASASTISGASASDGRPPDPKTSRSWTTTEWR